jgi:2-iminobutanoate/2-iminopropanoate deaminase
MSSSHPRPERVAAPASPYSPVVVSGDLVYVSGQVAHDERGELVPGGIEEQTTRALENLGACLRAAGCGLADVLKVNAYLADLSDFAAYNDVYRGFVLEPYPARTTVGAALAPGLLVEIDAVARVPA